MIRPPPRSTRTYTLFPHTTLFRARAIAHTALVLPVFSADYVYQLANLDAVGPVFWRAVSAVAVAGARFRHGGHLHRHRRPATQAPALPGRRPGREIGRAQCRERGCMDG